MKKVWVLTSFRYSIWIPNKKDEEGILTMTFLGSHLPPLTPVPFWKLQKVLLCCFPKPEKIHPGNPIPSTSGRASGFWGFKSSLPLIFTLTWDVFFGKIHRGFQRQGIDRHRLRCRFAHLKESDSDFDGKPRILRVPKLATSSNVPPTRQNLGYIKNKKKQIEFQVPCVEFHHFPFWFSILYLIKASEKYNTKISHVSTCSLFLFIIFICFEKNH